MANTENTVGEIFGRKAARTVRPITADMCSIIWSGDDDPNVTAGTTVLGATNISISYQQQVVRRRTLAAPGGTPLALIYPTQPLGSIQIQRLYADLVNQAGARTLNKEVASNVQGIFQLPGWNVCQGTASLKISFSGETAYEKCATAARGYRATGAVVTGYNISAEAEGLTVVDNVSIEFLQLFLEA